MPEIPDALAECVSDAPIVRRVWQDYGAASKLAFHTDDDDNLENDSWLTEIRSHTTKIESQQTETLTRNAQSDLCTDVLLSCDEDDQVDVFYDAPTTRPTFNGNEENSIPQNFSILRDNAPYDNGKEKETEEETEEEIFSDALDDFPSSTMGAATHLGHVEANNALKINN